MALRKNWQSWVLLLGAFPLLTSATGVAQDAPYFTNAQARTGQAAYRQHCASCHGARLEGLERSPGLVGSRFDVNWRGKPLEALSFHVRRMPPLPVAEPGSLTDETYAEIIAYVLRMNGFEAGKKPLPYDPSDLSAIIVPALESEVDIDAPSASTSVSTRLRQLPSVPMETLLNPNDSDWLHWGRTYNGHSYSPLKSIHRENVGDLKLAWRVPLREGPSMAMPLVHGGIMYLQTFPDTVLALDATSGAILWRYQYPNAKTSSHKMGLALHGDTVIVPTSDLHLVALHAKTGTVAWDHEVSTGAHRLWQSSYQLRSAPLIIGDLVVQGVTTQNSAPKGGFIVALDMDSGDEVWRFNTLAWPEDPHGNSWNDLRVEKRNGGSVWQQGTYDPELNLVYFGVAPTYDTGPLLRPSKKPGVTNDALYTDCTVALNATTGELVWHYQHLPNDQWDMDWAFERQIVHLPVDGDERKVVVTVGKLAILEALDARTGEYLFSNDMGVQNIVAAIDPETGAKTIDPGKMPNLDRPCDVCPSTLGARSWPPTAYHPENQLLYVPLVETCMLMGKEGYNLFSSGVKINPLIHPDAEDGSMGRILAIDLSARRIGWTHHQSAPPTTGLLTTAGGLVLNGNLDRTFQALDAATGEVLWQTALDDVPSSSVITYAVDGTQYVAVVQGLANGYVNEAHQKYDQLNESLGRSPRPRGNGGPAIWVFAL